MSRVCGKFLTWLLLQAVHDAEAVLELARKKAEASKEALAQVHSDCNVKKYKNSILQIII